MNEIEKGVDADVYCNITYIKGYRRIESDRRHLMEVIMDCIRTVSDNDKCKGCINRYRVHSVNGLIECKNDRTMRK